MKLLNIGLCLSLAGSVLANTQYNVFKRHEEVRAKHLEKHAKRVQPRQPLQARQYGSSPFLNSKSAKFAVNGSALPEVSFDVGESYAG